jgi:hypothetical protein
MFLPATLAIIALATTPFAGAENLVGNPGFESLVADAPAQWDVFLHPQEGAFARLDYEAHAGKHAVIIHVPMAHPDNPVNNWSQNLFGDFAGKTFRVSGYAKTVEVRDAAVWVQCWRKRPLRLLDTATTGTSSPLFGTRDWERIETTFTAPLGTEFMTVRCVLRGQGTVWFDEIAVGPDTPEEPLDEASDGVAPEAPTAVEPVPSPTPAAAPAPRETPPAAVVTTSPAAPSTDPAPAPPVSVRAPAAPTFEETEAAISGWRASIEEMRQSNQALLDEVRRLREELTELRSQALDADAFAPEDMLSLPRPEGAPPLVPYGEDWRSLL